MSAPVLEAKFQESKKLALRAWQVRHNADVPYPEDLVSPGQIHVLLDSVRSHRSSKEFDDWWKHEIRLNCMKALGWLGATGAGRVFMDIMGSYDASKWQKLRALLIRWGLGRKPKLAS